MASHGILEQKRAEIDAIKEKIANAKGLVIIDYMGLKVSEDTAFRKELRNSGLHYEVLKNTFLHKAFVELGFKGFEKSLNGPSAVAFSDTDVIAPAKAITECAKKYAKVKIKCGLADGVYIDEAGVKALAELPSKEVLIAKMLGSMQAPISNFVYCLNGLISGLAICLDKIAEQKSN
ncbi:MAG TPA: 50S ribosomal protein L10 [Clostridia bacterium]|nr:50S ribosomal protein L10 [Clostridia bacterium]